MELCDFYKAVGTLWLYIYIYRFVKYQTIIYLSPLFKAAVCQRIECRFVHFVLITYPPIKYFVLLSVNHFVPCAGIRLKSFLKEDVWAQESSCQKKMKYNQMEEHSKKLFWVNTIGWRILKSQTTLEKSEVDCKPLVRNQNTILPYLPRQGLNGSCALRAALRIIFQVFHCWL